MSCFFPFLLEIIYKPLGHTAWWECHCLLGNQCDLHDLWHLGDLGSCTITSTSGGDGDKSQPRRWPTMFMWLSRNKDWTSRLGWASMGSKTVYILLHVISGRSKSCSYNFTGRRPLNTVRLEPSWTLLHVLLSLAVFLSFHCNKP